MMSSPSKIHAGFVAAMKQREPDRRKDRLKNLQMATAKRLERRCICCGAKESEVAHD